MNRLNLVKKINAYTLIMKDRRKQNMLMLRSYLKKQRSVIIQKTQRKILRGALWVSLLSVSYYIAHKIYSQKLQVQQMQKKLAKLYPFITTKISTQNQDQVYYIAPQYDDQLANIIEMAWKFHFKVIVNSDSVQSSLLNKHITDFIADIPEKVREKCLIINLKKLNKLQIDPINGNVNVQSGITCQELNRELRRNGYDPIFPEQIAQNTKQTVYDAIVNNYPTNHGSVSFDLVNLDLISPQGQFFRSSNENNQYGATPNLNNIFVGTGGIFGLPLRTNFKIRIQDKQAQKSISYELTGNNLNQKLLASRKVRQIIPRNLEFIQLKIQNFQNQKMHINFGLKNIPNNFLQKLQSQLKKQLPDLKQIFSDGNKDKSSKFNIFFNINQSGFEKFLVFRQYKDKQVNSLNFFYANNLLKLSCTDESQIVQVISELCSENGVVVWCSDHKFLRQIKKVTDQSEVGSELMKVLVQIRQGIDHKKVFYTHNRYQQYFAKGTFRKLTQVFW